MSIAKDTIVEISQVCNGYIVRPGGHNWFMHGDDRRWVGGSEDYLVFRTMAELTVFLTEHFTYRAKVTNNDTVQTIKMEKKAA